MQFKSNNEKLAYYLAEYPLESGEWYDENKHKNWERVHTGEAYHRYEYELIDDNIVIAISDDQGYVFRPKNWSAYNSITIHNIDDEIHSFHTKKTNANFQKRQIILVDPKYCVWFFVAAIVVASLIFYFVDGVSGSRY